MSIKGQLTKAETNQWGFTTIWVSGTRYGADKKGTYPAQPGDIVEFEAYEKAGNDGRTWPTVKFASLRKVLGAATGGAAGQAGNGDSAGEARSGSAGTPARKGVASPSTSSSGSYGANRDSYWADKEATDKAKDPRISYQASYERAILFTDLAIRNGAFEALAKAKVHTQKLGILQAFVAEQADKIMELVYSAKVPGAKTATKDAPANDEPDQAEGEEQQESWS